MFYKDISLVDLVNLAEWQKIQDSFSEALEVTMETVSLDGTLLSNTSRPSSFCSNILSKIPGKEDYYKDSIQNGSSIKYPFGVESLIVPINAVGNRTVAYVILGPFITKSRKTNAEYAKEAQKYGINMEELKDCLIEINVFSYNKIHFMTTLVKDIFSYMAQTGYHKKRLGEIAPAVVELDPLFSKYYEEKILSAMLKACSMALNADSGSIMVLDKDTRKLHIKVASKLDNRIVNNTSVKIGEGIAGVAAATAKPIILPKDKNKNGLSEKMKRRTIKSSMIVPFNKGDNHDVYGVINLNIMRRNTAFSDKDISLVKELVNLTSIALIPLKK
jgi:ligand-binding sensor protein